MSSSHKGAYDEANQEAYANLFSGSFDFGDYRDCNDGSSIFFRELGRCVDVLINVAFVYDSADH